MFLGLPPKGKSGPIGLSNEKGILFFLFIYFFESSLKKMTLRGPICGRKERHEQECFLFWSINRKLGLDQATGQHCSRSPVRRSQGLPVCEGCAVR